MLGRLALAALVVVNAWFQTAYAQGALPTMQEHGRSLLAAFQTPCAAANVVVYDMNGYWLKRTIRSCSGNPDDIEDLTADGGAREKIFFIQGACKNVSYSCLVKGGLNRSFVRNLSHETFQDEYYVAQPNLGFATVVKTPLFVPTKLFRYDIEYRDGHRESHYAYGGLQFPRGMERYAYPLNDRSVIVSFNGYSFGNQNSLMGMLSQNNMSYGVFEYMQTDDPAEIVRTVMLPLFSPASAGPDWQALARSSPIDQRDQFGYLKTILATTLILGSIVSLSNATGLTQYLEEQKRECESRPAVLKIC